MDPSGSAMPPPLFSRRCRSVSFWWCFFSSSSDSYGLCGRLLGKLRGFWWLVGCRRRLCLRTVEETADSASQSSGSLRFVSIVEWCSFDGRSIHGDGGSPGDDSFPAWLLLDRVHKRRSTWFFGLVRRCSVFFMALALCGHGTPLRWFSFEGTPVTVLLAGMDTPL